MSQNPVGYANNIKPLFTETDRAHMKFKLDLWSYEHVKDNANDILGAVSNGSMPPGSPWPADKVDLFKQWIQGGYKP